MPYLNICVLLLCVFVLVAWINAEPYDYYPMSKLVRFTGNYFGEGVLRPGSDTGEGIFTQADAPSYSPTNDGGNNFYD